VNPERLEAIALFSELGADQRLRIGEIHSELEVAAGDAVVQEGDFGAALFAIEGGTVDVICSGQQIAVLESGRRIATVVPTSALRSITLLNRDVWRLEREAPATAEALLAVVERRATAALGAG
jgi:hypothetical protein